MGRNGGIDWSIRSNNLIVMDPFLSNKEKADKLGTSPVNISRQKYRILRAGGVDAFMKTFKGVRKCNTKKVAIDLYSPERKVLKDIGAWDLMISIIRENVPNDVIKPYVEKALLKIKRGKVLTAPEFYSCTERCLKTIVDKAILSVLNKSEQSVNLYDFMSKCQVTPSQLTDLAGHYLIDSEGNYYLDDFAYSQVSKAKLTETETATEEYAPIKGAEEEYITSLDETMGNAKSLRRTKIITTSAPLSASEPDIIPDPDKIAPMTIDNKLWDKRATPKETYDKIKSLYKKNKIYFNALIALREESDTNPKKVSTSRLDFYAYCEDKTRHNEKIYFICRTTKNRTLLFMKESELIKLFEDFGMKYKMLVDGIKYIKALTTHNIVVPNITRPYTDSVVLDWDRLSASVRLKNGLLNTLVKNQMLY